MWSRRTGGGLAASHAGGSLAVSHAPDVHAGNNTPCGGASVPGAWAPHEGVLQPHRWSCSLGTAYRASLVGLPFVGSNKL